MTGTLRGVPNSTAQNTSKHPLPRRWDHQAGDPKEGGLTLGS
jgi:hypothetical protein